MADAWTLVHGQGQEDEPERAQMPQLPLARPLRLRGTTAVVPLRRPQPGNHQDYYSLLHYRSGRRHWSAPFHARGRGSHARWWHRAIPALAIDGPEHTRLNELFRDRFLNSRSLDGVFRLADGHCRLPLDPHCQVFYYEDVSQDRPRDDWLIAYAGTYFTCLWNTLVYGFRPSGTAGDGGDHRCHGVFCSPEFNCA